MRNDIDEKTLRLLIKKYTVHHCAKHFKTNSTTIRKRLEWWGIKEDKEITRKALLKAASIGGQRLHKKYSYEKEGNPRWKGGISLDGQAYRDSRKEIKAKQDKERRNERTIHSRTETKQG